MEDHFARASFTLRPLGETQSVSGCQPFEERFEVERFSADASAESQCADSCAHQTTVCSSVSSRGARGSSRQDPVVAGCNQRAGRCRHGREAKSGKGSATYAGSDSGATPPSQNRSSPRGDDRLGQQEIGCCGGGSSLGCQEPG